jgi:hypothetical protein
MKRGQQLGDALSLLTLRRDDFVHLPESHRQAIDATRCIPTMEMYRLLDFYLEYGRFPDESRYGRARALADPEVDEGSWLEVVPPMLDQH